MSAPSLLDAIIQEIRAAAQEEAAEIIRKAEEEARRMLEEAEERARRLREEKRLKLLEEARRTAEAELAPKRLEYVRKFYTEQYNIVAEELRKLISQALSELRQEQSRYRAYLEEALRAAVKNLGSSLVVHPCKGERGVIEEVVTGLAKSNPSSLNITIDDEINCNGGFIASTPDQRVYFNATLNAKATELFERLLPEIFQHVLSARR